MSEPGSSASAPPPTQVAPLAISVVIATRDRDARAMACIASVLANPGFHELIVIDQSDSFATQEALASVRDPRLRYVRTSSRGVTKARNLGIDLTQGDIIAFTDDDCIVARDWVPSFAAIFAADSNAAVVCGRVRVSDDVQAPGFTESFEPHVREWKGRFPPFGQDWGLTANLAVRRDVVARVGKFDPMLGAGSPLISGGEPDFIFRVLRSGLKLVNAREVVVEHLGVRAPGPESRKLIRGYGSGTGAAIYKHVRLGDLAALGVYIGFVAANVRRICTNVIRGRRPLGLGYLLAFLAGSVRSYRFRVDRTLRQYVPR